MLALSQFFADLDLPSRKPCKPWRTEAYLRHLASEEWQRQHEATLARADRMSQRCYLSIPSHRTRVGPGRLWPAVRQTLMSWVREPAKV